MEVENANLYLFRKNRVSGLFASISIETEDMTVFQKTEGSRDSHYLFDRVPEKQGFHKVCQPDETAARIAAEIIFSKNKKMYWTCSVIPTLAYPKKG